MAKHKKTHRRLDPEDVLEGRAHPGAREILALIHDVNPSGHGLPARETARRYALKSRLQSLLVQRFPDEIQVEPGYEPGVVGLRHRGSGVDACHAVVASLGEDARSWVQMRLDVGDEEIVPPSVTPVEEPAESAPPSSVPVDDLSARQLLARGREALAAYDFDVARERFLAALERGSQEAAPLLLTVLVEHLGLDADALAVEARLDAGTLKQRPVRLLLALAAARAGERDRAVRLVRADEGDQAAEVFVALARGSLARGEVDQATRDVADLQRRAPAHPALQDLAATVKKRRAEARAPVEAEVQRLFDEGRFDEAEAGAAALAARWPESVVAHAVARAGEERRRREQALALAGEGRAALDQGEIERALTLLRRAIALGLHRDDAARAEKDLERAEAAARERRDQEKADEITRVLREGYLLRGLTDYVGLDTKRRKQVRDHTNLAELMLLEQTGVVGTGPEAKSAAQAVMALKRAITILKDDPQGALNLLVSHWTFIQDVPMAVQAADVARQAVAQNLRIEADKRLLEGMSALNPHAASPRENLRHTVKILESVRREHLDDEGRADLDRTLSQMRRMSDRLDRALVVGKLRGKSELALARNALDGLIHFEESIPLHEREASGDAGFIDTWRQQRAEVVQQLARSSGLRVYGPASEDGAAALLGLEAPALLGVPVTVLSGGDELLLVASHQTRIFFQVLAVASGQVVRRASYCLRDEVPILRVQQHAGRVALLGQKGLVELDTSTWEMQRAMGVMFAEQAADDVVLAPGGRFLWMTCTSDKAWATYMTQDTDRDESGRPYSGGGVRVAMQALPGLSTPRVLVLRDNFATLAQYEPRGAPVSGATQRNVWALPLSFTAHPSGEGLVALLRDPEEEDDDDEDEADDDPLPARRPPRVRWAELAANGVPRPGAGGEARRLPDIDPDAPYQIATGRDAGMVFILYTTLTGTRRLVGLAEGARDLGPSFAVDAPARLTLAQDAEARGVMAISPHEGGVSVVRLGSSPPSFGLEPPVGVPAGTWPVNLVPSRPCVPWDTPLWALDNEATRHSVPVDFIVHLDAKTRASMNENVLCKRRYLVARYTAAMRFPLQAMADDLADQVRRRFPGDPEMAQIPAVRAALEGRWSAVRAALSPLDPTPLYDTAAQHHDHLLGVALLMTGDAAEARRVLTRGASRAGGLCDLSVPLALAGAPGGASPSPLYTLTRTLDAAVRAADACLAANDPRGVRQALSPLAVREAHEVQTLARLCRAWLSEPDLSAVDRFARRFALASFRGAHAEKKPLLRRELPFAGATWPPAVLDALDAEANELLERERKAALKGEPEE